jgi:2-polyprenyl-3-methyl-5-hydroxy-6-metoxy-1,4-benzoquinol methylase
MIIGQQALSAQLNSVTWPAFCCPNHHEALAAGDEFLFCPRGDRFPLDSQIPRFATIGTYADAFGEQWKRYRLTQLDSYSGVPITRERTRRCLGEYLWENLADKQVLECGCGAGRFTEILLERGALVTSIDLSEAVESNQENFPQSSRHRIAQADILRLPFQPGQFDVVFCLGVIQHTPSPEQTIAALSKQVRPGGTLVLDHYTYSLSELTKIALVIRAAIKRMAPAEGLRCTERIVNALLPLHKAVRHLRWAQMLLSRVSPVASYYHAYPQLSDEMLYRWALLDTHDYQTCWFRRLRTRAQIERRLRSLGFQEITSEYSGNGVEARGRRPSLSVNQSQLSPTLG